MCAAGMRQACCGKHATAGMQQACGGRHAAAGMRRQACGGRHVCGRHAAGMRQARTLTHGRPGKKQTGLFWPVRAFLLPLGVEKA
eukprot:360180-Chlamydomonas_euryale.AAC.4